MGVIRKLAEDVARKIAAGEVVERPVSVVKELVENSLDAGATDVRIELLDGGKGLIRVTDDGVGMSMDDARLCFESHATSKIASADDLASVASLGFRGEALSSIAAVARVTLNTSDGKTSMGTQVRIAGRESQECMEIAFPRGTSLEVKDLFFNLPARKKFLRSARAELSRITRFLTDVALAFPTVRFALTHGDRRVFDYPAVAGLRERIYQAFGKAFLDGLIEFDAVEEDRRMHGFSSRPPSARRDRKHQFFFINRRLVKDPTVQAALNQAYRNFLEKDQSAEAVVFLEVPLEEVDVNVHPAKAEVRFRDNQAVYSFVYRSMEQTLLRELGVKEVYPERHEERLAASSRMEEMHQAFLKGRPERPEFLFPPSPDRKPASGDLGPQVLGQYLNAYIVAADEEGILVIDQHNAHERVLYDKYREIHARHGWPRQLALHPIMLELSPAQILSLEENRELLEESGFGVDAMGGRTHALKEYPDIFAMQDAKDVFLSLLEDVGKEEIGKKRHCLLATMACKTAVKAGEPLAAAKMAFLVEELFKTTNSALCPHGRPITLRLRRSEVERALRRK